MVPPFLRFHLQSLVFSRVLVSRPSFDQLPEGYEGEVGPTIATSGGKHNVMKTGNSKSETFYVHPRSSGSPNTTMVRVTCCGSKSPMLNPTPWRRVSFV